MRLGLPKRLAHSLRSTHPVESMNAGLRTASRNVKRCPSRGVPHVRDQGSSRRERSVRRLLLHLDGAHGLQVCGTASLTGGGPHNEWCNYVR